MKYWRRNVLEIHFKDPKKLKLYEKCMELNDLIFTFVRSNSFKEIGSLKSQIIRSATSIGANLTEGNVQIYPLKELSFYNNALGSAHETLYWLEVFCKNGYLTVRQCEDANIVLKEIILMLMGMMKNANSKIEKGS